MAPVAAAQEDPGWQAVHDYEKARFDRLKRRYDEIMAIVREVEPGSGFLACEEQFVTKKTPEYYQKRWEFLSKSRFTNSRISMPRNYGEFFQWCEKNGCVSRENSGRFRQALTIVEFNLITDEARGFDPGRFPGIEIIKGLKYADYDGYPVKLDMYRPKARSAKALPCIVVIHGGGWGVHKRDWFALPSAVIAREGYIAVNIDYRLTRVHNTSPVEVMHDAKAAVRWVRANAARYGIDPERIGATGGSAGAQMAAMLATTGGVEELEGDGGNAGVSSRIQAAVGCATGAMTGRRKTWPSSRGELPDWFWKVSPYRHVTEDDAPILLQHSENDGTVSVEEAKDLAKKYREVGAHAELALNPNKGHVFYINEQVTKRSMEFFRRIFEAQGR
jgi:pectinesterase